MLPSMPILFTRESQDAFGNKIEPSTSFFSQNSAPKCDINPEVSQIPRPCELLRIHAFNGAGYIIMNQHFTICN